MRTTDMFGPSKVKRQSLRQLLLWPDCIGALGLPEAEIFVVEVTVVLSKTTQHGRYPDPILEENTRDFDKVAGEGELDETVFGGGMLSGMRKGSDVCHLAR